MADTPKTAKYKNRVELTVRLGREPEARYLPTGTLLVETRAALNTGRDQAPLWLTLKAFAKLGADESVTTALNHCHKGQAVTVVGRFDYREYVRQDGSKGSEFSVVLYEIKPVDQTPAPSLEQPDLFETEYAAEGGEDEFPF